MPAYNWGWDNSRTYKPMVLPAFSGELFNLPTLEDPVIQRLAKENKADIFATETAVSAVMTAPKSLYSWDVIIRKHQDKVFIDKRDEQNMLDCLTVNETSQDNQPMDDDSINGVRQLMQEAVKVNRAWRYHHTQKDKKKSLKEADPFVEVEDQVVVRQGYLYKIWDLGNKKKICIRSTLHAYLPRAEEEPAEEGEKEEPKAVYQNTYALVEFEGNKTQWKQQLDQMMALCLTKEVQDNSCKISRWVVESLLAGADQIKFAFVTRKNVKDNAKHIVLGTYGIETKSFCNQINLSLSQCWGILRDLVDSVYNYNEPTGDYIFMKDPNKALMRLFKVTVEEEEDEEPDEEL